MLTVDKEQFKKDFKEKLITLKGKGLEGASSFDLYETLGSVIKDIVAKYWVATNQQYYEKKAKQVYYFSMEFLTGRMLEKNLLNMGAIQMVKQALNEMEIELESLYWTEPEPGVGNGGLGRLAACFLDSLACMELPGHGCGIRYKYGHFQQKIVDGYQVELPDNWLKEGNIWEIRKSDKAVHVKFGGTVKEYIGKDGKQKFELENYDPVLAVPYDIPMVGYHNNTVNNLRLWNAEAAFKDFDFSTFNHGEYLKAVESKYKAEAISQILYPDDTHSEGRLLRLKQEYFLASAGVQSVLRTFKKKNKSIYDFPEKVAIHINDTHPVLVIPEMMRILMDEEGLDWEEAWQITIKTCSFTNHTLMAEALEKWPIDVLQPLLPRIYMIIHEINERFTRQLWSHYPGQWDRIHDMAIIADGYIKMAHLAVVGSHSTNGVAKLHTEILKREELNKFYQFFPHKFNNKTNGITHRRWLLKCNPGLANVITDTIGESCIKHPDDLVELRKYANDRNVQEDVKKVKQENKARLAHQIKESYQVEVDPKSIFDVQIKRLHGYKRQLMNALHILHLYNELKDNPNLDIYPRTFIFGAKAAPGYYQAKLIIKLINSIAALVNNDKAIQDKLKVVFMENYNVSLAEEIIPAADVSEQISTASKEASGTGNMKLMMNGALTLGTLDGANVEIREEVGDENIITFGLTDEEVLNYYRYGGYNSWDIYHQDDRVKRVMDQLVDHILPAPPGEFKNLYDSLLHNNDEFFVLKDFGPYTEAQKEVEKMYRQHQNWVKKSIINIAHSGQFSSDRTIQEYSQGIWELKSEPIITEEEL